MSQQAWSRRVWIAGVVLMFAGLVDPLEGSLAIAVGTGCVASAARLSHSLHRRWAYVGFALVAGAVAWLWAISSMGGIGGNSGRSWWWGLPIVLYPVGWGVSLVGAVKMRREGRAPQARP